MAPVKPKTQSKKSPNKPKKVAVEIGHEEDDDRKPGCIYLGHIPHGFYERQMRQYFGQFGKVVDVKLCRSKKTKNSKGYGFVKFKYSAVAKTVAETCNNYLFLNKLLKCEYKPLSDIHKDTFKKARANSVNLPKSKQNNARSEYKVALSTQASVSKATKKLEKLKSSGLDVDLKDIMTLPDMSKIQSVISTGPQKNVKEDPASTGTAKSDSVTTPEPAIKRRKADPSDAPEPAAKRRKADPSDVLQSPVSQSPTKSPKRKKVNNGVGSPAVATPKSASKKTPAVATPKSASKKAPAVATPKSASKKAPAVATPKSASKKTPAVATPKSASKKTPAVATPKSASKKTPAVATPKSASKKTPAVATPKSASKKTPAVATPKSASKKTPAVATPKSASSGKKTKLNKTPTPTVDTPSRKRKRV